MHSCGLHDGLLTIQLHSLNIYTNVIRTVLSFHLIIKNLTYPDKLEALVTAQYALSA